MREKSISPGALAEKLDISPEGLRKLLKNESTTDATATDLAYYLGVHVDVIKGEAEPIQWREGTANDAYKEILKHDRKINALIDHIVDLYRLIGKPLSEDQVKDLNKL